MSQPFTTIARTRGLLGVLDSFGGAGYREPSLAWALLSFAIALVSFCGGVLMGFAIEHGVAETELGWLSPSLFFAFGAGFIRLGYVDLVDWCRARRRRTAASQEGS